jgi:multidrug efflux system membrane fusion protein
VGVWPRPPRARPAKKYSFRAKEMTFLENNVDRQTGTITARATIANDDLALLPGQYVRIRLATGKQPDALLIP